MGMRSLLSGCALVALLLPLLLSGCAKDDAATAADVTPPPRPVGTSGGGTGGTPSRGDLPGAPAAAQEFRSQDILFDFNKYDLRPDARAILDRKVMFMSTNQNVRVQIEGHCDERGTTAYNLALGERRANTAKQYMVTAGVSAGRLGTISYGEERPLDSGHTEAAWAKNRRAHFEITGQ